MYHGLEKARHVCHTSGLYLGGQRLSQDLRYEMQRAYSSVLESPGFSVTQSRRYISVCVCVHLRTFCFIKWRLYSLFEGTLSLLDSILTKYLPLYLR